MRSKVRSRITGSSCRDEGALRVLRGTIVCALLNVVVCAAAVAQEDPMQTDAMEKFNKDVALCYKVGLMPWENERKEGSGPDSAFNCRDFTRWFIECMERLGHPAVAGVNMLCDGCDSRSKYGHRIVVYQKPDGMWCPGEPQNEENGEYTSCCNEDQRKAAACATHVHCDKYALIDACCDYGKTWITSPNECKKERCCYEEIDEFGNSRLQCSLPVIGDPYGPCPPEAQPKPPLSPEEQECQDAIKRCLGPDAGGPGDGCRECRRRKLPECGKKAAPEPPSDDEVVPDGLPQ